MKGSMVPFLALRYLTSKRKNGGAAPSALSVAGVAVGVMTLAVVLAVMNGFQIGFMENMVEIGSYHLQVRAEDPAAGGLDPAALARIRSVAGVTAVVPFSELQALVEGAFKRLRPCFIRAVPEDLLSLDPVQAGKLEMMEGSFDLSDAGSIVIGSELSINAGTGVGDVITLHSAYADRGRLVTVKESFTVSGVFRCGYLDYDEGLVFVSEAGARRLTGTALPPVYGVKLADRFRDAEALKAVSGIVKGAGYAAEGWQQYNKSFFGALLMEKLMIFVMVGLIFIVVGFNIYHSLRRTVFEKKEEIAVLKAVGVPPRSIRSSFMFEGLIIGTVGVFAGLLLGIALALNINGVFSVVEAAVNGAVRLYQIAAAPFYSPGDGGSFAIFSPLYFYLTEVPARVLLSDIVFIAAFALASSVVAAFAAARSVASFRPAEILRYE